MSTVETGKFEPSTGTALNLGASGDAVTLPAGVTLKTNTIKDAGGNTIFTSDGAGTLSSVNSGLQGNMVFISSQTASGSASLSFTSGIDSTYDEYVFYFVNIRPATDNGFFSFQANATDSSGYDRTMTTTYFDAYHEEDGTGGAVEYRTGYDQAQGTAFQTILPYMGNDADGGGAGELHLFSPSSTTYVKHFYIRTNYYYSADASYNTFVAGYINDTTAIDDVQFKMSTGNIDTGSIYLYGIK
jgi:hypothetical protein